MHRFPLNCLVKSYNYFNSCFNYLIICYVTENTLSIIKTERTGPYRILYSYFMPAWGIVKTAAPRCRGQFEALSPEAERPRAMVHRVIYGTEGQYVCLFRQTATKQLYNILYSPVLSALIIERERASLGNTETYKNSNIIDAVISSLFVSDTRNMRHPSRLIAPG